MIVPVARMLIITIKDGTPAEKKPLLRSNLWIRLKRLAKCFWILKCIIHIIKMSNGSHYLFLLIFSSYFKYTECLDKRAFVISSPLVIPCIRNSTVQYPRDENKVYTYHKGFKDHHLKSSNALQAHKTSENREPKKFAGFDDVFNSKFLFSKSTMELPLEDLAAREADYVQYESKSNTRWRQFITVAASAVAVGILYKALSLIKVALEKQYQEVCVSIV
ncbi:hypothetical protein BdWA1_003210 [Babesia duncani]|uniref:Uncharacterized protein n=1 Tax=Babesia duncani TaxID=323732 RepID=A0AAD9UN47_9APIC|nr:hypothetical protein BdWA1_003210 [Babesia duncani]